jgi:hypothetical protein
MKKISLTIVLFFVCSPAYATTWYACSGGGNWASAVWTSIIGDQVGCTGATGHPIAGDTATLNATSGNITIAAAAAAATIDETGYTGTLAFGTQNLTLTAASKIGGAMTNTSGFIVTTGNITLLSTATGTFPTIEQNGAVTFISGGFTWPGAFRFNNATNATLNGNWITSGLTTFAAASNLIVTSAETYTTNGGLTMTSATGTSGSLATIILGGGTWSSSANASVSNSLNFAGNVTVSGNVYYKTGEIQYISGTPITTGSTLNLTGTSTISTNGMVWNNITGPTTTMILNLVSNLVASGKILLQAQTTFSGADDITTSNFTVASTATITISLAAKQRLNVTNAISIVGNGNITVKSGTVSSPTYISYYGVKANQDIGNVNFTDVTAGAQRLYNQRAGVQLRTVNIYNIGPNNFLPNINTAMPI